MNRKTNKEFYFCNLRQILTNPINGRGFIPENNSEIFVRGIPETATIFDLENFFDDIGEVYQIRLMMKPDSLLNRGFGYVTYINRDLAQKAIELLRKKLFLNATFLKLEKSLNNCRIFLGGVPIEKSKDEIWQLINRQCQLTNIVDVITYKSYSNPLQNRGFVFLEFRTHQEASYFRAKFSENLVLWGKKVLVDWAIPIMESDCKDLNDVKIIFMRHLPVTQTTTELTEFISQFLHVSAVEKIFKFKDYAYIHLTTRVATDYLLKKLQNFFKPTDIEIKLANPPNKYNSRFYRRKMLVNRQNGIQNKNDQSTSEDVMAAYGIVNRCASSDLKRNVEQEIYSNSPPSSSSSSNSEVFINFGLQSTKAKPIYTANQTELKLDQEQSHYISCSYDNFDKKKCINCNQFFKHPYSETENQTLSIPIKSTNSFTKTVSSSLSSSSLSPNENTNPLYNWSQFSKLYTDLFTDDMPTSEAFNIHFDEKKE